jgi:hypothetical protein
MLCEKVLIPKFNRVFFFEYYCGHEDKIENGYASHSYLAADLEGIQHAEALIRHNLPAPTPWPPTVLTRELKTYKSLEDARRSL